MVVVCPKCRNNQVAADGATTATCSKCGHSIYVPRLPAPFPALDADLAKILDTTLPKAAALPTQSPWIPPAPHAAPTSPSPKSALSPALSNPTPTSVDPPRPTVDHSSSKTGSGAGRRRLPTFPSAALKQAGSALRHWFIALPLGVRIGAAVVLVLVIGLVALLARPGSHGSPLEVIRANYCDIVCENDDCVTRCTNVPAEGKRHGGQAEPRRKRKAR